VVNQTSASSHDRDPGMRRVPLGVVGALLTALALALGACGQGQPPAAGGGTAAQASGANGASTSLASGQTGTPSTATGTGAPTTAGAAACKLPSLRTQIAQLIIVGFPGTAVNAQNTALVKQGVGGLIVFRNNVQSSSQLKTLLRGLKSKASIPLEIAVDQEPGTRVARLRGLVPTTPSAAKLGKLSAAQVRQQGLSLGRAMKALGITADFAPVLDVVAPSAPPSGIIGDRAFGSTPAVVSRAGIAFHQGLRDAGIGTIGKHFPGHGQTTVDSHKALPVVNASKATLLARDIVPYKNAIKAGLPAVMVGHLLVPSLDADRPTSLSPKVIDGLLRRELGFGGLIVTDALEMGAISGTLSIPVAAERALLAGADQLLLGAGSTAVAATIARIEQGVRSGRVPASRVRSAFLRVERFKGVRTWEACR
jgi:beta-N-acetylhexosaminidase